MHIKDFYTILIALLFVSCNSTQLSESWKNPEVTSYAPSKVFIVGLTSNLEARQKFETKLQKELELRGIEAITSIERLEISAESKLMTAAEIEELETNLSNEGFDTILLSKIIGMEDKIVYKDNYGSYDETHKKFKEDYLKYQDVFYNPEYYDEYIVYHAETTMHCICPMEDRTLLWKGYIDILDPKSNDKTINNYVNIIIAVLEDAKLLNLIDSNNNLKKENMIN